MEAPKERRRSLSLKNLSFRHSDSGSKKMKGRKSKSSGDVRQAKDLVLNTNCDPTASPLPPTSFSTPTTPASPESPVPAEDGGAPVSRRKKMWESFRVRTRLFRRKNRGGDKNGGVETAPDTGDEDGAKDDTEAPTESPARSQGTPRSRSSQRSNESRPRSSYVSRSSSDEVSAVSRSSIRRWRSEIVRQVSVSDSVTDMEAEMAKRGRTGNTVHSPSSILVSRMSARSADGDGDNDATTAAEESLNGEATRRGSDSCGETVASARNSYGDGDGGDGDGGEEDGGEEDGVMEVEAVETEGEGGDRRMNGKEHEEEVDSGIALQASETALRQRQTVLMEHPFFLLDVKLQEGVNLVIRDSCGTSDPYVKFKIGGKQVYRSRTIFKNLNPKWDESFTLPIEDISKPLYLKVFDYDRGFHDDPMGNALIDISQFELGKTTELQLKLSERGKTEDMGYLILTCTLQPKTQEDKDQFMRRTVRVSGDTGSTRKLKLQMWTAVVTIVLVDGRDLVPMDDNGLSDPYVKFRLGAEKYRSKVKYKTLTPRWLEQFDLRLFNEQSSQLEITVFDYDAAAKDDFMGRASLDVSSLETEVTHRLDLPLEDGAGRLTLLLTVSGLWGAEAVSDLANHTPDARQQEKLMKQYKPLKLSKLKDVGHLQVKVFKACSLKAADLGGLSDPFCVLELVNDRRQTHTEYKTLNPEWNKIFEFPVLDIHSVLEVTVFDEDRDKKVEFLGKVAIPLLRIKSGERRWYALKDKKLLHRSKGAILLEMNVLFNHAKAAIRTVNPAETKLMQVEPKFKIQVMKRNIDRVSQLVAIFVEGGKFLQSCFSWESTARSLSAFIIFLVMVWSFELYMLPITLLIIFLKNLVIAQILGALKREPVEGDEHFEDDDDDDDEDKEKNAKAKEEKKSFKEKLQSVQDVCLQVQQGMDMVASLGERVKNTFNWTVPWLSMLAVVALTVGVIVLYHIPLRWLLLAWGINKFTKKLRKPNAINNNELLDFLSRVPSDSELAQYRELRPELSPPPKKKRS